MQSLYGAIANTNKKEIMAVSIDKVYQKVLALANKEQRGYITPQEFNLFADHAQMEIFEQYFYDVEQFERRMDKTAELTKTKIEIFKRETTSVLHNDPLPANTYLVESVFGELSSGKRVTAEKMDRDGQHNIHASIHYSPLLKSTINRPVYWITNNKFAIHPQPATVHMNYIITPKKPNWNYVIASGNPLHVPTPGVTQDFQLHASEENALVIKILQLAGVAIKDFNLVQIAGQKEISTIQQEKQ